MTTAYRTGLAPPEGTEPSVEDQPALAGLPPDRISLKVPPVLSAEVGADYRRQAGAVELDREIFTTTRDLLRPGAADLDPIGIDQRAGSTVACA